MTWPDWLEDVARKREQERKEAQETRAAEAASEVIAEAERQAAEIAEQEKKKREKQEIEQTVWGLLHNVRRHEHYCGGEGWLVKFVCVDNSERGLDYFIVPLKKELEGGEGIEEMLDGYRIEEIATADTSESELKKALREAAELGPFHVAI